MPDSDHSSRSASNPGPVLSQDDALNSAEVNFAIEFVIHHLRRESEYLDTVIECSLKMKNILSQRQSMADSGHLSADSADTESSDPEPSAARPAPDPRQPHAKLDALRQDLARQFVPVHEGRQQMKVALQEFKPFLDSPTVSALAPRLNDPARGELKKLRDDIKDKLNEVRAITMGNQAVLVYTMDFYHRLLTGLSSDIQPAKAYNKSGKLTNQVGSGMLQKEC